MTARATLRRWHTWLGWLVGVPLLLWTASGLVMVARPIEEVRGNGLLREFAPLSLSRPPVAPALGGVPFVGLSLEPRADGARWVVSLGGDPPRHRLADPATGQLLPKLGAIDAQREVIARFTGAARVAVVARVHPADPPLDLNRPLDGWQVAMDDGTHFYVDAGSGEVVARRTRFWRFYDFMWGLHIMDLGGRKDTHHPWIVLFTSLALVMTLLALVLLPLATRRRSSRRAEQPPPV